MRLHQSLCRMLLIAGVLFSTTLTAATNDPLRIVKQLYVDFDAGDIVAVGQLIDAQAVWTYHGPPYALPFAGAFHGSAGVLEFFRVVDETLTDVRAGQDDFLVSDEQVIVPGWEESTVRATGGHYRVQNVHIFKVHDNRIVKFDEYIDSGEVLEAFTPADTQRGRALYTGCAICHGAGGAGNPYIQAASLLPLDSTYLLRQLRNLRSAVRGSINDEHGWMMSGRANALPGDRGVRDVVAYIESLPHSDQTAVTETDHLLRGAEFKRGEQLYQQCAGCHGEQAEGVAAIQAPALKNQDPHYILLQLRNFYSGIRGSDAHDVPGQQMQAAAKTLKDDRARRDLIAYLHGLSRCATLGSHAAAE